MKPHPRTPEFQRKADAMSKPTVPPVTDEEKAMLGLTNCVFGEGEHVDLTPYIYPQVRLTLDLATSDRVTRMELALAWHWLETHPSSPDVAGWISEAIKTVDAYDCGRESSWHDEIERGLWDLYEGKEGNDETES